MIPARTLAGIIGTYFDDNLAADAVRLDDAADHEVHIYWSVSTTSTRMPRPPIPATSVRAARWPCGRRV